MSGALTRVRVLPARALCLQADNESTTLHVSGDELDLTTDDAATLERDGFVERIGDERRRRSRDDDEELS